MKWLSVTAMLLLLCSCDRLSRQKPHEEMTPLVQTSTASEQFELQSKCSAMGERIMRENIIGRALSQDQTNHYNPRDNRCYVKLTVTTADLTTPRERFESTSYLYDGQTREMLAYVNSKGDKKFGVVFDSSLVRIIQEKKQSRSDFDAVSDLIDGFIATERRQ